MAVNPARAEGRPRASARSSTPGPPRAATGAWRTDTGTPQSTCWRGCRSRPATPYSTWGCGSGYAARALRDADDAGRVYGLDGAPEMAVNAREYTDDHRVSYLVGDLGALPFADGSIDHAFSMKAGETLTYSTTPALPRQSAAYRVRGTVRPSLRACRSPRPGTPTPEESPSLDPGYCPVRRRRG